MVMFSDWAEDSTVEKSVMKDYKKEEKDQLSC